MGVRESMNKKPVLTSSITVAVVALAIVWLIYWHRLGQPPPMLHQLYYTDDDGKTLFADDMANLAPFAHDGKEAVLAHVFQIGTNPPFAAYLEKYTPEMKEFLSNPNHPDTNQDKGTL